MSLLAYPLAAMAGGLVGTLAHESAHAVAAAALGELEGVGWQGGLAGRPFVEYRYYSRVASEAIRKAPYLLGLVAAVVLVMEYPGRPTLWWVAAAAMTLMILRPSPEDFSARHAHESATDV